MKRTEWLRETRMLRFEKALEAWTESRLTQEEAARLLGVCARTFRRYVDRHEEAGIDGLLDKRLSQMLIRKAPVDEVMRLRGLYRESYGGWSVAHFHDRYRERHAGQRSYTWVKSRLQEAGLVAKGKAGASRGSAGSGRRWKGCWYTRPLDVRVGGGRVLGSDRDALPQVSVRLLHPRDPFQRQLLRRPLLTVPNHRSDRPRASCRVH